MEEVKLDESIRRQASNYLYIPELKNSEVLQVIANRNQHSIKPQGGKHE